MTFLGQNSFQDTKVNEPSHVIMTLNSLHKGIFQMRMRNEPVGLEALFFAWTFF